MRVDKGAADLLGMGELEVLVHDGLEGLDTAGGLDGGAVPL